MSKNCAQKKLKLVSLNRMMNKHHIYPTSIYTIYLLFLFLRGSTEEPTTILKTYREEFLTGRKLDLAEVNETIEGETSTIFVGRHTLWDDANSEIKSLNDIRHPLEVQFYGEQSEDFGGPRKEFFRLALNHIRTSFLVQGVPVKLLRSSALIEDQSYYTAGIIVGNEMTTCMKLNQNIYQSVILSMI